MAATMQKPKHINVPLTDEVLKRLNAFKTDHGWTQRESIEFGVQALELLMEMHEQIVERLESDDLADLYREVARELPVQLVEPRPKPDMQVGWTDATKEKPAVQVDGWYVTAENGDLVAENKKGERGRVERGVVRGMPSLSPKKAVLATPSLN